MKDIVNHADDLYYLYDRLDELTGNYSDLLNWSGMNLFGYLSHEAPHAVFALFGHSKTRKLFVLDKEEVIKFGINNGLLYNITTNSYTFNKNASLTTRMKLSISSFIYNAFVSLSGIGDKMRQQKELKLNDYITVISMDKLNSGWNYPAAAGKKYVAITSWDSNYDYGGLYLSGSEPVVDARLGVNARAAYGYFPVFDGVGFKRANLSGYPALLMFEAQNDCELWRTTEKIEK